MTPGTYSESAPGQSQSRGVERIEAQRRGVRPYEWEVSEVEEKDASMADA